MKENQEMVRVPKELFEKVSGRIHSEQQKFIRTRIIGAITAGSFLVFVFVRVITVLVEEISESGFFEYLSLLTSDFQTVISVWREYVQTLLESFPVVDITALLLFVLMFIITIQYIVRYIYTLKNSFYAY